MSAESMLVLEFGAGRLHLLVGSLSGGVVCIERVVEVDTAQDVDAQSGEEFGRWLGQVLREHGIRVKRAWVVLGRSDVVVKPLHFEAVGDVEGDLPGMVRLQMARQLSIPIEESVVDYAVVRRDESGWLVLAGAAPEARVQRWRQALRSAGLSVAGLGLVSVGLAALASAHELESGAPALVVAPLCGQLEIVVCRGGRVLFSRSSPLQTPDQVEQDDPGYRRLITEVRRAWTSYRLTASAQDIGCVLVFGEESLCAAVAESCGEAMAVPGIGVSWPMLLHREQEGERVAGADEVSIRLGGTIAAAQERALVLNFAMARRAPDRWARHRQAAMLAVLAVIVVLGTLMTLGLREVRDLGERVEVLRGQYAEAQGESLRATRELARLKHIEAWLSGDVDWLGHLSVLSDSLPRAEDGLLDRMTGSSTMRIDYVRAGSRRPFDPKHLQRDIGVELNLSGRARTREIAEALRGELVSSKRYLATPVGDEGRGTNDAVYPVAFGLRLLTTEANPEAERAGAGGEGR